MQTQSKDDYDDEFAANFFFGQYHAKLRLPSNLNIQAFKTMPYEKLSGRPIVL